VRAKKSMKIKIFFVYDAQLNEDGVSAYMDADATFGVAIGKVCGALGMRVSEWSFFFGPYEDRMRPLGLVKYRTPRDCGMDEEDEVEILCVSSPAHN
jgi:hypothetical protein